MDNALQQRLHRDTPILPTDPSLPPPELPCCTKRVWVWMNSCFLSWVSFCYIFLFICFSSWRETLREGVVSQPFLSYHDDLWLYFFFYGLLSSYRSFFIWTYRAKAICSVTPFKVSAKPPGTDLDHVFVCDVTVGCSGNDYNVSQRKHLVFMRWADSRNILVLQNKTQRFFFVQMFSIITTNQGKEKMKKMAFKLYFCFLSMQVLNYMIL